MVPQIDKQKNDWFKKVYHLAPIAIELYNASGQMIDCNQSCLDLFGISDISEVIGFNLFEDPNLSQQQFKEIREGKSVRYELEFDFDKVRKFNLYETKKSGIEYLDCSITAVNSDKGEIIGYLLYLLDVSGQKMKEEEIREISEQWEATFNSVNDAIWLLDTDQRIIRSNRKADVIFGQDCNGKHCYEVIHGTDHPLENCPVQQAFISKHHENKDIEIGNRIYNIIGDPILDDSGNVTSVVHIVRDITFQKLTEKSLRENEKWLTELNATRDKLFSIIAHDLKSPFNAILGFSGLLVEKIKEQDNERSIYFSQEINAAAKNTLVLLENLLDWAKTQTGRIEVRPEAFNIYEIVQSIFRIMKPAAEMKNISLNCEPGIVMVFADQKMVEAVLRNLVQNAIKFSHPGGVVDLKASFYKGKIKITVTDQGVGMERETINGLFDIATTVTTRGTGNEKGTGLGLVLCREFVGINEGEIWVESEPGKGSEFYFTLPAPL